MQPLVPSNVDLRGLPFMPLDVSRLRDSELAITASGDAFRAAVLLWCSSWNQVPAASVPDHDQALASYAGYGRDVKGWLKVKKEAMRGFVLCDDGRWYHPVVAEKAMEAWDKRTAYGDAKSHENDRKKRERTWRRAAFEALRSIDVVIDWNSKTALLRELVKEHGLKVTVTGGDGAEHVTSPVTVTGHGLDTAKTGTGTGTGTDIKDQKLPPVSPKGDQAAKPKGQTLKAWLDSLPDGAPAIPEDHHVFAYADRVGLPHDFVGLAWEWFQRKYLVDKPRTRQLDWPGKFRNAVEDRWGNLWWINHTGAFELTTAGQQLRRSMDAEAQELAA